MSRKSANTEVLDLLHHALGADQLVARALIKAAIEVIEAKARAKSVDPTLRGVD